MAELFRGESMEYIQLVLDDESSRETIRTLGEFGLVHIEDHGTADSRLYKENKRRILECLAWKRKLEAFRTVMGRSGVAPPGPEVVPDNDWQPAGDCLEQIQRYFEQLEKDLLIQFNFKTQEMAELNTQLERKFVLLKARDNWIARGGSEEKYDSNLNEGLLIEDSLTNSIHGTIPVANRNLFEKMIYRVARGHNNALCSFDRIDSKEPFNDPVTHEPIEKMVFTVLLIGTELPRRIRKICVLFGANLFDVPKSGQEMEQELTEINRKRIEAKEVLKETNGRITALLTSLARNKNGGSPLVLWERAIDQEQHICEALIKFYIVKDKSSTEQKIVGSRIAAKCWVPQDSFAKLQQELRRNNQSSMAMCTTIDAEGRMPPTYFKTNRFTGIYQSVVDTYGVANYKEANPGLFTIITFPFLFGVMYGDIFHGSVLTIGAIYMIANEKKLLKQRKMGKMSEIPSMVFGGRYMLILMGIFAMYCGIIYNDCASIPLDIYGSRYVPGYVNGENNTVFNKTTDAPYPFGIDPAWYHKANSLQFTNSMKMKLAVTLGVIQMSFGLILGLTNDLYHGDILSVLFTFIPRITFMSCTFGYMIFMIIYKFFIDYEGREGDAPNLIQTMIKMFLSPSGGPPIPLYDAATQKSLQIVLVIIALICIPLMLFPKAIIKKQIWKSKYGHLHHQVNNREVSIEEKGVPQREADLEDHHDPEHRWVGPHWSFSDEMITTGIHTIEFLLGCVSNTASYLRLWALSLAHAELSEVFWDKVMMQYGINIGLSFVGIAVWTGATAFVLLAMDVLECFLHALRLHWVEFQNKFYCGEGHKFTPFKFDDDDE